ncbi:MAG: SUMF1/EgtB/PvdO family nonheme iron enzyme [Isosphaeraceae bacterium]
MSNDHQESPGRDGSSNPASVDLFLSYNSRDHAAVQQVRTLLGARGLSVFYDRESLGLGLDWFDPLERSLRQVHGVVVFLGPNGLGRWQKREMALALDRQTTEPTFPVIPVLLPEGQVENYGGFLLQNTWADLRGRPDDPDTLDAIARAVRGTAAAGEPAPPPAAVAICPYLSLNAFHEEDAPLFFGRDRLVDEPEQGLLHKVLTCPLVAVVGASGSGKSSVVRAGLLPRLRREPPSRGTWDTVVFLPGRYPFFNLAVALEAVRNPEASEAVREADAGALSKGWKSGDVPLELSLGRAREALRVDRLLVVVDQFEELVTLTPKDDRQPFLSRLLAATGAESKITVLLTLRADYYSAIYLEPRLSDGVQRGLVNVGAMTPDERRSAIEGPARRVGLEFEPGLVNRLLDDVGDEPGNLPLLEFALTELWERREGRGLTNAAYEALGRVVGAIGRRADAVFNKLTDEQKAAAPRLFGRLVRVTAAGEEGADTRQRVRLGDLDEVSRAAVEPFVAGRLLVTARDPGTSSAEANPDNGPAPAAPHDPTTVEVAHEALIRQWNLLKDWIKNDREFLLWRQRLGFQIAEWERSGRDSGTLLRGALLREAHRFARSRRDDLNDHEREFLARSKSQFRRRLLGIGVITILAILGGIEFYRNQRASALFKSVQTAKIGEVPGLVQELAPYRGWADPWLIRSLSESKQDHEERLRYSLALLPVDAHQREFLFECLCTASPDELPVIRDFLKQHQASLTPRLWSALDAVKPGEVSLLPPASALADYDAANPRWESAGGKVAQALVSVDPAYLGLWRDALRPVRGNLNAPLAAIFRNKNRSESERALATSILADYAKDDPDLIADLLMDADPKAYAAFLPIAQRQESKTLPLLQAEIAKKVTIPDSNDSEMVKDRLAERQARAAVALLRMGRAEEFLPLLRHSADPRLRSFIVNWLNPLGADPKRIAAELDRIDPSAKPTPAQGQQLMDAILFHPETSQRRALILALGTYGTEGLSSGEREPLTNKLLDLYRNDPDSGIHGAAEWTLRQWQQQAKLEATGGKLRKLDNWGDRRWFMNSEGQTFAVIEGPVEFRMGSPPKEPDRFDFETLHRRSIPRRFAIATKEVTVEEYQEFVKANPRVDHANNDRYSPDPKGPMNGVEWFHAAAYCNWLSSQEKLPECYLPNERGEYASGMKLKSDALERKGYRLPTEAEWEYACRAGAETSRFYGSSLELLRHYAWFLTNSEDHAWSCGSVLPNELGLFDMLGNLYEWCQELALDLQPDGRGYIIDNIHPYLYILDNSPRICRGGPFNSHPSSVRSAFRGFFAPAYRGTNFGFRPSRTYP